MSASEDEVLNENNASAPPESPKATAPPSTKSRPRLDLSTGAKERKRGKSMFGLVLGTLNKAKIEDKERNASDAAKKRQLTEQRLQNKLRKETDSVRRAEEAKKEKSTANRKEEELQLKDSIFKYRRTHLPQFSRFLCTSDDIPGDEDSHLPSSDPLALPSRSHPPPLYYLPVVLLPSQKAYINRRVETVADAVEKEWDTFRHDCKIGIEEVSELRKHVIEEEYRRKEEREAKSAGDDSQSTQVVDGDAYMDDEMAVDDDHVHQRKNMDMENDGKDATTGEIENGKDEAIPMQADEDDAVEY